MDTGRLLLTIRQLEPELRTLIRLLQKLRQELPNRTHQATQEELSTFLSSAASNSLRPSQVLILRQINGLQYTAPYVSRLIESRLADTALHPTRVAANIEDLQGNVQGFENAIGQIRGSLEATGLAERRMPIEMCEVGVLLPSERDIDLGDLNGLLKRLDEHLRVYSELSGRAGSPVVSSLENGSREFFFLYLPIAAAMFGQVISFITKQAERLAGIQKTLAEVRKIDTETADLLEKKSKSAVGEERENLIANLVANVAGGRANELRIMLTNSIEFFEEQTSRGMILEISGSPIAETTDSGMRAALESVARDGAAMARLTAAFSVKLIEGDIQNERDPPEDDKMA